MAKKTSIPDPLSEIATNLVATLESHRAGQATNSESQFLTWSQLVASQVGVSTEWATAALKKAPAKGQVIVAIPDDLKSPVGLQSDIEKLASDSGVLLRLVQHPSTGCSDNVAVRPLNELCRSLDKSVRARAEAFWTANHGRLPSGLAGIEKKAGKKSIVTIHDERFARPDVVLCQKLLKNLESLRSAGETQYPAEFRSLLSKLEISVDDPLLAAAVAQPQFSEAVSIIAGKLPNAWVAFRKDAEQCLGADGFLKRLLIQHCSEAIPEVKLSVLSKQLVKDLQARFMELWRTHYEMNRGFAFVELSAAGTKSKPDLLLRDARFPRVERLLSAQLVKLLEGQKIIGGSSYPLLWSRLAELAGPKADPAMLLKAKTVAPFTDRAILAFPTNTDSPVALGDDAAELAASPSTLDVALSLALNDDNQAIAADKLPAVKGMNLLLKSHFAAAVEKFVSSRQFPVGFAALKLASKWHIFRLKDLSATAAINSVAEEPRTKSRKNTANPSQTKPTPSAASATPLPSETTPDSSAPRNLETTAPTTEAADSRPVEVSEFSQALDAAFDRLSSESRLPGCVSLVDLRPALSIFPREVFDAELVRLRKAGQYSLSVVEGRYPLSEEENAACLTIENTPHLLIRKRVS